MSALVRNGTNERVVQGAKLADDRKVPQADRPASHDASRLQKLWERLTPNGPFVELERLRPWVP
jgi:hypothetical protein